MIPKSEDILDKIERFLQASTTYIQGLYNEERDLAVKNARKEEQLRIAKSLAGILSPELISEKLGITIEDIYELQNAEG